MYDGHSVWRALEPMGRRLPPAPVIDLLFTGGPLGECNMEQRGVPLRALEEGYVGENPFEGFAPPRPGDPNLPSLTKAPPPGEQGANS